MNLLKRVAIFEELTTLPNQLGINFLKEYTHIRGYHGCRPIDVNHYYQNGIIPISKDRILSDAIFRLKNDINTVKKIKETFEVNWRKFDSYHKAVWFSISKEELVNKCGHYLIYGSEFVMELATQLYSQHLLKQHGLPTVFCCDISLENLSKETINEIEEHFIKRDSSGGFKIIGKLNPIDIDSHFHPEAIYDWHNSGNTYRYL